MNKLYLVPILLMTSLQLGAVCKMMENEPSLEQAEEGLLIAQELHPFKQLFNKEKDGFKKATYLNNAISKSPSEIKYEFDPIIINPGEVVYLEVPENISKRDLLFMVLGHRQNPATEKGTDPVKLTGDGKPFDHLPGLISVQVNRCSTDYKSDWRYWNGMASGEYGSKFAEVGYNMELEGLYEWYKSGHGSVKDKSISTDRLCVNGIRLVNTGKDAVEVGELGLKVTGPKTSQFKETNISPSNKFGDYFTASGRNYGERKDSIMLGYDSGNKNVPDGWTKEDNELYIPAPVGKKLSSLELSIGDQHKDGSSGWGKISAGIKKADGSIEWFVQNENVPPHGVIMGNPVNENYTLKAGDKIIVKGDNDDVFLSGIRWGIQ